jgi:hypothetical protein
MLQREEEWMMRGGGDEMNVRAEYDEYTGFQFKFTRICNPNRMCTGRPLASKHFSEQISRYFLNPF